MAFLLLYWRWVLLAALIASNALTFKLWRGAVEDLTTFKAQVAAIGEQAKKDKERIEAADKALKEKTDANHKRTVAALHADVVRLRNSGGGGLSAPTPPAGSPDRTCFDPAKLDSAIRGFGEGVLGVVETGSKAVIDLDAAKDWAQNLPSTPARLPAPK